MVYGGVILRENKEGNREIKKNDVEMGDGELKKNVTRTNGNENEITRGRTERDGDGNANSNS